MLLHLRITRVDEDRYTFSSVEPMSLEQFGLALTQLLGGRDVLRIGIEMERARLQPGQSIELSI